MDVTITNKKLNAILARKIPINIQPTWYLNSGSILISRNINSMIPNNSP